MLTTLEEILDRDEPPPPQIWTVRDEAVIRRAVGGRDVMRLQLGRLLEVAKVCRSPESGHQGTEEDCAMFVRYVRTNIAQ